MDTIAPGDTFTDELQTAIAIEPGNYRIVYDLRRPGGSQLDDQHRMSPTFVIE